MENICFTLVTMTSDIITISVGSQMSRTTVEDFRLHWLSVSTVIHYSLSCKVQTQVTDAINTFSRDIPRVAVSISWWPNNTSLNSGYKVYCSSDNMPAKAIRLVGLGLEPDSVWVLIHWRTQDWQRLICEYPRTHAFVDFCWVVALEMHLGDIKDTNL